jgi:hypothetical protein
VSARLRPILVVSLGLALLPAVAIGRDPHAPAGASDNWLPCDAWVMFHWLPYDEGRLYSLLRMSRTSVRAWLRDDNHHTLGQLFARRGLTVQRAARSLVAPFSRRTTPVRLRVLRSHAVDSLTQGHLAQHLLFHYYHQPLVGSRAQEIFGVSPRAYRRMRLGGLSPADIGRAHGRSPHEIAAHALRLFSYAARAGIRSGQTSRAQASEFLRIQRRGLRYWLGSRINKPGAGTDLPPKGADHVAMLCFLLRGDGGVRGTGGGGAQSEAKHPTRVAR